MERPKIGYCQRIDEAPSVLIVNTARLHELVEYSVWAEQQLSKLYQPTVSDTVCPHYHQKWHGTQHNPIRKCETCGEILNRQTDR